MIHETSRSPRVRRTRARRLANIEEAALDLIVDEGLEALTMARLAEEVDLTPGALYRYFTGKDALIVALQARALGRIEELLEAGSARPAWPADGPTRAVAELWWAARFYRRLARSEPRVFALVAITVGDPRHLVADAHARAVAAPVAALLDRVARMFDTAAEVGALAPGEGRVRAAVFWSAVHGLTAAAKLDRVAPDTFAPMGRLDELARALLAGWGAAPPILTAAHHHVIRREESEP